MKRPKISKPYLILWIVIILLVIWTIKNVPIQQAFQLVRSLQIWPILVLVLINIGILFIFSLRWWIILRAFGYPIFFPHLVAIRLAGFSVSYFTPGPQVGGEPLQIMIMQKKFQIPMGKAVNSVYLDKLFEFLVNFTILVIFLILISTAGMSDNIGSWYILVIITGLLIFPAAHLIALWKGIFPLSGILHRIQQRYTNSQNLIQIQKKMENVEIQISSMIIQYPFVMVQSMVVSIIAWVLMIFEYFLTLSFLGINLDPIEVIFALTMVRLAFLFPLPGGLGVLEAGQVLAMTLLGVMPVFGMAVSLIIRIRDILMGIIGLGLGVIYTKD